MRHAASEGEQQGKQARGLKRKRRQQQGGGRGGACLLNMRVLLLRLFVVARRQHRVVPAVALRALPLSRLFSSLGIMSLPLRVRYSPARVVQTVIFSLFNLLTRSKESCRRRTHNVE